ncbi:hypothetical protein B0H13DRAFT_1857509 [Mycena leptocephala]|nr:hypothetical protein B0H13DRAFT_1857509 [Mycena leptocephala]
MSKHKSPPLKATSNYTEPEPLHLSKKERRHLALKKYREKNRPALRVKARDSMKKLRDMKQNSEGAGKEALEKRKAADAEYRERQSGTGDMGESEALSIGSRVSDVKKLLEPFERISAVEERVGPGVDRRVSRSCR